MNRMYKHVDCVVHRGFIKQEEKPLHKKIAHITNMNLDIHVVYLSVA